MGLLAPLALLIGIPLAGAIIVLYLLKLKRKERIVSSVFLWRQAIQDVQANAPFQKLRKNLLLFIQLGIILLVIAALARPFSHAIGLAGQNIVIIIDSSASMRATDIGKSRFDEAKTLALDTVDRMGRGDSVLVITAAAKTRVISSFTSDRKSLTNSIKALEPQDTRANLREAIVLGLSLVAKKRNPQIVIISDGGFAPVTDVNPGKAKINFIRVGKRSDNVGIVALDARKSLSGVQQVFAGIRNFSDRPRSFNIEVYLNGQMVSVIDETLDKGASKQEILSDHPHAAGRLTLKMDINDDLASDNEASVYLAAPKKLSVLLVTPGNLFLERAFNLNPQTELTKTSELPASLDGYNIIIFDRIAPPDKLPGAGYLIIDTDCKAGPGHLSGKLSKPTIADWTKSHPVTSYVDFSSVFIKEAKPLTLSNWGQGLIECEGGQIAAAGESNGRRFVMLGWDLTESDFPLRVGFPIFITNCIEWLSGSRAETGGIAVRTGEIVPINSQGEKELTITSPDGISTKLNTRNTAFFDGTERVGIYKIKLGKKTNEFACNMISPAESDTRPRGDIRLGERQVAGERGGIRTNREYWRSILLVGLAFLAFEWYAFHRRLG